MKPDLFLRADGSINVGYGHVYRLLALGQILSPYFTIHFVTRTNDNKLLHAISENFPDIIRIEEDPDNEILNNEWDFLKKPALIILDGYKFHTDYQDSILRAKHFLIFIDDIQSQKYHAHLVINHAPGLSAGNFSEHSVEDFYLGPSFSILRKEFLDAAKTSIKVPEKNNVFICFGGGVQNQRLCEILDVLIDIDSLDSIHVLLGNEVYAPEKYSINPKITFYSSLSAAEIIVIVKNCCLAITSASTISYEMASVGIPLFIEQTADNQSNIFKGMIELEVAKPYKAKSIQDFFAETSSPISHYFSTFVTVQRKVFDGKSDERLAKHILEIYAKFISRSSNR